MEQKKGVFPAIEADADERPLVSVQRNLSGQNCAFFIENQRNLSPKRHTEKNG